MKVINLPSRKNIKIESLHDIFGLPDQWELCAWPISYNSSVSFIFRDTTEGDVSEDGGKTYHFKVCIASDFSFSRIQQKDIALDGLALVSLFFWRHGYATVVRDQDDYELVLLYDEHGKVVSRINIGRDACRLMVAEDGRIIVGYAGNFRDTSPCFAIYSANGEKLYECQEASARSCTDITVDNNCNIWASCFPSTSIYKISPTLNIEKKQYSVASAGALVPIQVNGQQQLIQLFGYEECPIPINYLQINEELFEVRFDNIDNCEISGASAYGSLAILLTEHGKLYFFDLNEASRLLP